MGGLALYAYVHDPNSWVDVFGLNAITHIFHGEINKKGKAVGFHYEGSIGHIGKARITEITQIDQNGIYKAKIEVFSEKSQSWITKSTPSTFFPKEMSKLDVLNNINQAFENKTMLSEFKWEGVSNSGIKIEGYMDNSGNWTTAYPKLCKS